MEGIALLDPEIDSKHRAARLCQHQKIEPLITRTPKENWRTPRLGSKVRVSFKSFENVR